VILAKQRVINILQVEDTPSDAVLTEHALKSSGVPHSTRVITNGSDAITFLKNRDESHDGPRPDLILLDLSLPGVNGHEVLKFIKGDPELKRIPVVIFSTLASDESQLTAYGNSANSYVVKPLDLATFTSTVQSIALYWSQTSEVVPRGL
jgi:CheY-like chemotaxis protein